MYKPRFTSSAVLFAKYVILHVNEKTHPPYGLWQIK